MGKFNDIPFNEPDPSERIHPLTGKPLSKPGNKPDQNPEEDPSKKKKKNPYEITF
jgi:hypothetical protein